MTRVSNAFKKHSHFARLYADPCGSLILDSMLHADQIGRLENHRGDPSAAYWFVYQVAAKKWEEPGPLTRQILRTAPTGGTEEQTAAWALAQLRQLSLVD